LIYEDKSVGNKAIILILFFTFITAALYVWNTNYLIKENEEILDMNRDILKAYETLQSENEIIRREVERLKVFTRRMAIDYSNQIPISDENLEEISCKTELVGELFSQKPTKEYFLN